MFIDVFKTWEFRVLWRVLEKDNTDIIYRISDMNEPKPLGSYLLIQIFVIKYVLILDENSEL
jgi:hypothetical protein